MAKEPQSLHDIIQDRLQVQNSKKRRHSRYRRAIINGGLAGFLLGLLIGIILLLKSAI